MRRVTVLGCALVLLAGAAGTAGGENSRRVSVTVKRYAYRVAPNAAPQLQVTAYTLSCDPPAGTLPFARRICADIRAHPVATLSPPAARETCSGAPPELPHPATVRVVPWGTVVRAAAAGKVATFGHPRPPACHWPGDWSARLYSAAASGDPRAVRAVERTLGCAEDPALLAVPPPWTLIYRCMGWPLRDASTNGTTLLLGRYPWLAPSMRRTVVDMFGGIPPVSTRLIDYDTRYDRRVIALFEFAGDVDCLTCGDDPTALADDTTARVFRVSYDPATRRGLVTRLCETVRACR
jgi:hypothetical protein